MQHARPLAPSAATRGSCSAIDLRRGTKPVAPEQRRDVRRRPPPAPTPRPPGRRSSRRGRRPPRKAAVRRSRAVAPGRALRQQDVRRVDGVRPPPAARTRTGDRRAREAPAPRSSPRTRPLTACGAAASRRAAFAAPTVPCDPVGCSADAVERRCARRPFRRRHASGPPMSCGRCGAARRVAATRAAAVGGGVLVRGRDRLKGGCGAAEEATCAEE